MRWKNRTAIKLFSISIFKNFRFKMKISVVIVMCLLLDSSKSKNAPPILMTAIERELFEISSDDDELVFAHVVSKCRRKINCLMWWNLWDTFRLGFWQIHRHGERNIAKVFPNDPYKDEIHWPGGFGQLTNEGKMHLYKLGQYFRRRYHKILGNKYSANKVYVQSVCI